MGETAIDGPQPAGGAKIAVIKDPVGAVLDLHNRELISDGDDLFDGNESLAEVSGDGELLDAQIDVRTRTDLLIESNKAV